METVSLFGMLGVCAVTDFRRKEVEVPIICLGGILGVVFHVIYQHRSIEDMLGGFAIGVIMYVIAVATREQVGKGDALLCMVTGIYLGFLANLALVWLSTVLVGIFGLVAVKLFHKTRGMTMPYVPFLLATALILRLAEKVITAGGGDFVAS